MLDAVLDWQSPLLQEAAIKLYQQQSIQADDVSTPLISVLLESHWLIADDLAQHYVLTDRGVTGIEQLLDLRVPHWRRLAEHLDEGLGEQRRQMLTRWHFLEERLRSDVPHVLNRSVAEASLGCEAQWLDDPVFSEPLPDIRTTEDRTLHLRGHLDLKLQREHHAAIALAPIWEQLHEAVLSERDLMDVTEPEGDMPFMVMTVEDRGVFMDLPVPDQLLLVWAPGPDTTLVSQLLRWIPQFVPHVHFGHLDHQGLLLAEQLGRESQRPVRRFIPGFWQEYCALYAEPVAPGQSRGAPWQGRIKSVALLDFLMREGLWMKQSPLVLDVRLHDEIRRLLG